jgi:hypothetical protein
MERISYKEKNEKKKLEGEKLERKRKREGKKHSVEVLKKKKEVFRKMLVVTQIQITHLRMIICRIKVTLKI